MAEERVFFRSDGLEIEGLIDNSPGEEAVVVTHPHPLYGGNMRNNVVASVVRAYRQKGYTTLRFNFRGVGRSEGSHDKGQGERNDVRAALDYLRELGKSSIDLAGYSFGAWVNAMAHGNSVHAGRIILISPPVSVMDFSFLAYSSKIRLVITGSEDEISSPSMIREILPAWNPEADFEIIQGADHFYWGSTDEIEVAIRNFLVPK
ncbi:MAG: alpha/beta fold hydrolase [Thermodesulfobacteriota bacterium]|nr:alpha/beta fold hydrolase [Thermodesulfobacteriota bacterium]